MRGGGVRLVGFLFAVDGQKNRRSHLTVVQVPLKRISYLLFSFMWIVQLWAVQIAFPFKYNNSFLVLEYWLLCKAVHQFKGVLTHASTVSANTLKELTDRLNYRPCFFFHYAQSIVSFTVAKEVEQSCTVEDEWHDEILDLLSFASFPSKTTGYALSGRGSQPTKSCQMRKLVGDGKIWTRDLRVERFMILTAWLPRCLNESRFRSN